MTEERPYTLVAELTYRCPLQCVYCSNPLDLGKHRQEIDSATWARVIGEAEGLGVVQLNLTGGEPLVRTDLEAIVSAGRQNQMYINLITSGVPLTKERLVALKDAGIDAVQLSLQDATPELSRRLRESIDSRPSSMRRDGLAELGLPLTLNVVLHRDNLDRVADFVGWAERLGAERLELANTQYLGWALANRDRLLPSRAQLERARGVADEARARLRGKMEVLFVLPGLLLRSPQGVHGRLGAALHRGGARWARSALPPGAHLAGLRFSQCARSLARFRMERVRGLPALSRRELDAGPVPYLRSARA